jgi:hypothetical protein
MIDNDWMLNQQMKAVTGKLFTNAILIEGKTALLGVRFAPSTHNDLDLG